MTAQPTSLCRDCGEATDRSLAYHTGCCPHACADVTDAADNGCDFHSFWYECTDCGTDLVPGEDGWEAI